MTIAAHIASSSAGVQQNFRFYLLTCLAAKYPEHHFIFIFDRPFDPALIEQKNITPVLLGPPIKNNLLRHYWYNFKMPSILNRYQADVFFTDGICCSLRTNVHQCMLITDLDFLEPGNSYPAGDVRYIKKFFKKFISRAAYILVHNGYIAKRLEEIDYNNRRKIHIIPPGGNINPAVLSELETSQLKSEHTGGADYFIAFITSSTATATVPILKAFSAFKKWQRSAMQMVLLTAANEVENVKHTLLNYKYREEVKVMLSTSDKLNSNLVCASYAAIYLPSSGRFESDGMIAYLNHIPLITINNDFQKSMYGEAAVYTGLSEKDIAEKMMRIYKDENMRRQMINSAASGTATVSTEDAAGKLWNVLAGNCSTKIVTLPT